MRKIERQMCDAILDGKNMSKDNTTVSVVRDEHEQYHSAVVRLHGNEIAHYYWSGMDKRWVIRLTDSMWQTPTTKSRLNALLEGVGQGERLHIYQTKHKWHYQMGAHDYVWTGDAVFMANEPTK